MVLAVFYGGIAGSGELGPACSPTSTTTSAIHAARVGLAAMAGQYATVKMMLVDEYG